MPSKTFKTQEEWHALRATHIGSSDVAVLLGVSKRKTRWSLFLEKAGTLPPLDLDSISHIRNGKRFESAVAHIGAETFDCRVQKVRRYNECDDCPDLGVSMDYEEVAPGMPPVEIKWSVIGAGWEWDGNTVTQAPDEYLVQVQAQLACNPRAPYARLWGFIHGEVRQMIVEPRPAIIQAIKTTVRAFMDDVRAGREPPVDFAMDGETIDRMVNSRALVSVDWSDNPDAAQWVKDYRAAADAVKAAEDAKEVARNQLLKAMLDAAAGAEKDDAKIRATTAAGTVTIATVAANPGRVITPEDVGQIVGAKKGYRRMTVKEKKDE